jgi:WD40 repeat protein
VEGKENENVNCVTVSPDGRSAASASFDGTVILWEVQGQGAQLKLRRTRLFDFHGGRVWRVAFSPDNDLLAAGSDDGAVRVWKVSSGVKVAHMDGQDAPVNGVEFLDPGTLVSTGDDRHDRLGDCSSSALKVWSLASREFTLGVGSVKRLDVSVKDDGAVAVSWLPEVGDQGGDSRKAQLFIGEDGRLHRQGETFGRPRAEEGSPPSWAGGGRSVAPARRSDTSPAAADAASAAAPPTKELASISNKSALYGAPTTLYGGVDGTLQLWGVPRAGPGKDAGVPVLLRAFRGHQAQVIAAGVSPNGRYIVSGDEHGTLLAWDLLRPRHCRDFELKFASAYNRLKDGRAGPEAQSLNEWFKFRGFSVFSESALPSGE